MLARTLVALLALFAAASPRWMRGDDAPVDLSEDCAAIVKEHDLPAAGILVIRDGVVVAQGVSGVRCQGKEERVTIDDKFHIGSCTKAMTAILVGTFVDEGQLTWETTVGDVLGEKIPNLHPDYKTVTLRQLLSHRGGDSPAISLSLAGPDSCRSRLLLREPGGMRPVDRRQTPHR